VSTRIAVLIACAAGQVAIVACSDNGGPAAGPPVGIVITPSDTALQEGRSVQYHARLVDSAGATVAGASFTWTTDAAGVATVSTSGLVSAHHIGGVLVTAASDTFSATAPLTVIDSLITTRIPFAVGAPIGLAVTGSKAYVTLGSADSLAVLDVAGERATAETAVGHTPTGVAFNPAGTRAYVTNQLGSSLSIVDAATNGVLSTLPMHGNPFVTLTSGDGGTVWVTSGNLNRVYAVNATSPAIVDSASAPAGPNGLARHPTLSRLYVSGSVDGKVYELDAVTLDSLRSWSLGGSAQGMVLSGDGATLFVANESGWVDAITLATGTVSSPTAVPGTPYGLALSPDGTRLAVSSTAGNVLILDAATLAVTKAVQVGGVPRRLAYRADGSRLLVANEAGWVDFIR
jgi:YVTN family beta-propeller protein